MAPTCSLIMWAQHEKLPLIPESAYSPPSGALASPLALSLRLLGAEKGGREVAGWFPSIKVGLSAFNFD